MPKRTDKVQDRVITSRLNTNDYDAVKVIAQEQGMTVSKFINKMIHDLLGYEPIEKKENINKTKEPDIVQHQQSIYFLDKFPKDYSGLTLKSKVYCKGDEITLGQLLDTLKISPTGLRDKLQSGKTLQQFVEEKRK